jgi:hypothetical protein
VRYLLGHALSPAACSSLWSLPQSDGIEAMRAPRESGGAGGTGRGVDGPALMCSLGVKAAIWMVSLVMRVVNEFHGRD